MFLSTALMLMPFALKKGSLVHFDGDSLTYGRGPIYATVLIDNDVLGKAQYAKTLRQSYDSRFTGQTIMLFESDKTGGIPFAIKLLVSTGKRKMPADTIKDISPKHVAVVNPCYEAPEYMKDGNFYCYFVRNIVLCRHLRPFFNKS